MFKTEFLFIVCFDFVMNVDLDVSTEIHGASVMENTV